VEVTRSWKPPNRGPGGERKPFFWGRGAGGEKGSEGEQSRSLPKKELGPKLRTSLCRSLGRSFRKKGGSPTGSLRRLAVGVSTLEEQKACPEQEPHKDKRHGPEHEREKGTTPLTTW